MSTASLLEIAVNPKPTQIGKGTSNPKGWGKGGGKSQPYDQGKGKGYGSPDPWSLYNLWKGKGKGQGGNGKGFAKGGKGTYSMEQEWYPQASYPDGSWPEPWPEQGPEEQPILSLLSPWKVRSPKRTFKPGPPPGYGHGKVQHISTCQF